MAQNETISTDELSGLVDTIIRAGELLVEEIEVYIAGGESVSAELKKTKIGVATGSKSLGLGIRTIDHGRIGSSGTNDPLAWRKCLDAAVSSGTLATPQEWGGLPGPAGQEQPLLSFDPEVRVEAGIAEEAINEMLKGAAEFPVQVMSGSSDLSTGFLHLANSNGICYSTKKSMVSVSLEAISDQSTGYEFDQSVRMSVDPENVGKKAAFFAHHNRSGADIKTGNYLLVLSPMAMAQLLGNVFIPAVNGRNVHAGRSKLAQSLGQEVADTSISIYDDPFRIFGPGSTWWDAEGVPTRHIDIIKDGILNEFLYDLKSGYRYGKQSTGSALRSGYGGLPGIGYHNLVFDGPRCNIWDEPAIYVHDVVGAHTANPMSGDFSVEISNPSWIENGTFGKPIRKAMYAGNVFDLLKEIDGIAKGERIIGSMVLPEVRLGGQRIIGT
ncbi:MAG: TldD/PmbA family protein [Methanoregulaceae archaeon]|nr:TldD/PmbA family protein [Methanoregulaceae archaeon]